jgi:hypothetical protein
MPTSTRTMVMTAALVSGMSLSSEVAAQSACQRLDGEWAGTMSGRFVGPVSISVKDCRIVWVLPDGRRNHCDFAMRGETMDYTCSLGSRGTVVPARASFTMRNTYTGNDYVVTVRRR